MLLRTTKKASVELYRKQIKQVNREAALSKSMIPTL